MENVGSLAGNVSDTGIIWTELDGEYNGSSSAEEYTFEDDTKLDLSDMDQKRLGVGDPFKF